MKIKSKVASIEKKDNNYYDVYLNGELNYEPRDASYEVRRYLYLRLRSLPLEFVEQLYINKEVTLTLEDLDEGQKG